MPNVLSRRTASSLRTSDPDATCSLLLIIDNFVRNDFGPGTTSPARLPSHSSPRPPARLPSYTETPHRHLPPANVTMPSERTVSRILRKLHRPPNQTWRTFLHNHVGQLVSIDFFTVPTITMRVLFVLIVLEHHRRKVLHFHVTGHPTGAWTAQQIVEAFADRDPARTSSAIGTAGTVLRFDCESSRWACRIFSQHRAVHGRIHMPSDSSARFEGSA